MRYTRRDLNGEADPRAETASKSGPAADIGRSFAANVIGTAWSAVIQLVFTPLYLRLLGAEAFGLIAFSLTLQSFVQVLDFGMAPTTSREVARYAATGDAETSRRFVLTFEIAYWSLAALVAVGFAAATGVIARGWLDAATLSDVTLRQAASRMALLVALQFPVTYYQAVLRGLDRQVSLNALRIGAVTLANGLGLLAAWKYGVVALFTVQIAVLAVHAVVLRVWVWRRMPAGASARFDGASFRRVWRFSAAMTTITIAGVVISQIDKLVISAVFPLASFGYYTLGWTVASALIIVITPAFNTLMPQFAALAAHADRQRLRDFYMRSVELITVVLAPAAAVIALFSYDIIRVWLGSADAARQAAPIATLLVIGTALNGVMNIAFALQLGEGWMRLAVSLTVGLLCFYAPLLWFLVTRHGVAGAAMAWLAVNSAYFAIGLWLTQRRVSKTRDLLPLALAVAAPASAALICAAAGRMLLRGPHGALATIATVMLVFAVAMSASVLASPTARAWVVRRR